MAHLARQEVTDRINKARSPANGPRTKNDHAGEQKHRPEFYIPRITRRLARFIFNT